MNVRIYQDGRPVWLDRGPANGVGWDRRQPVVAGTLVQGESGAVETQRLSRQRSQRESRARARASRSGR